MSNMRFDQYLERATELRDAMFHARTELLLFLIDFEASGTWEEAGFKTFERLLVEMKLSAPAEYADFAKGRRVVKDLDTIHKIGAPAVIAAGKIADNNKRAELIRSASLRVEEEGFPLSQQAVDVMRAKLEPNPRYVPQNIRRVDAHAARMHELELANETLRKENASLKSENEKLKKKVAQYADTAVKKTAGRRKSDDSRNTA